MPNENEHLRAVENRVLTYHLQFSYEEILRILADIAKQHVEGISEAERLEIVDWIGNNTTEATKNLNIRLYQHLVIFYKWNKEEWKTLAQDYIKNDEYTLLIIQGLKEKAWCEATGKHRATYYRIKQRLGLDVAKSHVAGISICDNHINGCKEVSENGNE
jgi:hypothetical protein